MSRGSKLALIAIPLSIVLLLSLVFGIVNGRREYHITCPEVVSEPYFNVSQPYSNEFRFDFFVDSFSNNNKYYYALPTSNSPRYLIIKSKLSYGAIELVLNTLDYPTTNWNESPYNHTFLTNISFDSYYEEHLNNVRCYDLQNVDYDIGITFYLKESGGNVSVYLSDYPYDGIDIISLS